MTAARRPTQLLHVDSSVLHDNSVSRGLCAALVERWRRADQGLVVTYRDLAANPIAHLSPSDLQTGNVDAVKLSDDARRDSKLTDELAGGRQTCRHHLLARWHLHNPERRGWDFQENYLRLIFGFVGITDVSVVRAEGLALGVEARDRAVSAAHASLETLFHQAA